MDIINLPSPTSSKTNIVVQTNTPISTLPTSFQTEVSFPPGVRETLKGSTFHPTDSDNMYIDRPASRHYSKLQHRPVLELLSWSKFYYIKHTNPVSSSSNWPIVPLSPPPVPAQQASTTHSRYTHSVRSPRPSFTRVRERRGEGSFYNCSSALGCLWQWRLGQICHRLDQCDLVQYWIFQARPQWSAGRVLRRYGLFSNSFSTLSESVPAPDAKRHKDTDIQAALFQMPDWIKVEVALNIFDTAKAPNVFTHAPNRSQYSSVIVMAIEKNMYLKSSEYTRAVIFLTLILVCIKQVEVYTILFYLNSAVPSSQVYQRTTYYQLTVELQQRSGNVLPAAFKTGKENKLG